MEMAVYSNCLRTISQPNVSYELYIMENYVIKSVQVTTPWCLILKVPWIVENFLHPIQITYYKAS